jgi:hypothetical protein
VNFVSDTVINYTLLLERSLTIMGQEASTGASHEFESTATRTPVDGSLR